MTVTRLQVATGKDTGFLSTVTATLAALTNPSLIILAWLGEGASATVTATTPTDTAGHTYTQISGANIDVSATFDLEIWYTQNTSTTAHNAITITDNLAGADGMLIAEEWTGLAAASIVDSWATGGNATPGSVATTAVMTTTNANDLLWSSFAFSTTTATLTAGAGYSNLTAIADGFTTFGVQSQVVSATGGYVAWGGNHVSESWAINVVSIQAAAGAVAVSHYFSSMGLGT